ncbi:hypothetical protein IE53DRAFT_113888 [Violaceomyces palustris]|uniref:Uncharacterized protein n=1 Tax=Violaceomyces palustris TaxID=1673888 RepID=A0ACD0NW80_9BASI|nr:hypothetical protein IE53DRAFT_113888 [Violaceomyces palustris]
MLSSTFLLSLFALLSFPRPPTSLYAPLMMPSRPLNKNLQIALQTRIQSLEEELRLAQSKIAVGQGLSSNVPDPPPRKVSEPTKPILVATTNSQAGVIEPFLRSWKPEMVLGVEEESEDDPLSEIPRPLLEHILFLAFDHAVAPHRLVPRPVLFKSFVKSSTARTDSCSPFFILALLCLGCSFQREDFSADLMVNPKPLSRTGSKRRQMEVPGRFGLSQGGPQYSHNVFTDDVDEISDVEQDRDDASYSLSPRDWIKKFLAMIDELYLKELKKPMISTIAGALALVQFHTASGNLPQASINLDIALCLLGTLGKGLKQKKLERVDDGGKEKRPGNETKSGGETDSRKRKERPGEEGSRSSPSSAPWVSTPSPSEESAMIERMAFWACLCMEVILAIRQGRRSRMPFLVTARGLDFRGGHEKGGFAAEGAALSSPSCSWDREALPPPPPFDPVLDAVYPHHVTTVFIHLVELFLLGADILELIHGSNDTSANKAAEAAHGDSPPTQPFHQSSRSFQRVTELDLRLEKWYNCLPTGMRAFAKVVGSSKRSGAGGMSRDSPDGDAPQRVRAGEPTKSPRQSQEASPMTVFIPEPHIICASAYFHLMSLTLHAPFAAPRENDAGTTDSSIRKGVVNGQERPWAESFSLRKCLGSIKELVRLCKLQERSSFGIYVAYPSFHLALVPAVELLIRLVYHDGARGVDRDERRADSGMKKSVLNSGKGSSKSIGFVEGKRTEEEEDAVEVEEDKDEDKDEDEDEAQDASWSHGVWPGSAGVEVDRKQCKKELAYLMQVLGKVGKVWKGAEDDLARLKLCIQLAEVCGRGQGQER